VVDEGNTSVTLDARLDRRGLVVLNESLTDGWTVTVDGEKADPVRVNSVMRGVVAGPGRHEIVWSYAMPGLKAGALLSVLALLTLIGGAIALIVGKKRRGVA
ncbi:MAG: YfhO family protein, partial [Actinomycetota bacterium]